MSAIGIIGILAAMALLIFFVYKGMTNVYVAFLCAAIVCVTNGLPILEGLLDTYLGTVGGWMKTGFVFAVIGSVFGTIYDKTGAADSLGKFLLEKLSGGRDVDVEHDRAAQKKLILTGLLCVMVVEVLMTWTGISGIIVVMASIPLVKSIAKTARIPKRYLPGLVMFGSSVAMAGPGSPCIGNIMANVILGTPASSALIPGLIGSVFIFAASLFYMYYVINRGIDHGIAYEEIDEGAGASEKPTQNFVFTLLPLIFVFITYSLLQLELVVCMLGAIVLAILLFCVLGRDNGFNYTTTVNMLNDGIKTGSYVYFTVAALMGFAGVVQSTASFNAIIDWIGALPGHPLVIATFGVIVFCLLTASPVASLQLGLAPFKGAIEAGTLSAAAIHRCAVVATTTFESMPYSGAAIIAVSSFGVSFKDSYKHCFVVSVLITLLATILEMLILVVFPGLA